MTTKDEQLISGFVAAWERAPADELVEYFADDAVWHPIPVEPVVGKEAIRKALSTWLKATEQLGVEIHRQVSDGRVVMHERTDRFSFGGREHRLPVCAVFEVDNGRITAWREYFDASKLSDTASG